MLIFICYIVLMIDFFLLARHFDRLTAKSILDAQLEIIKFQKRLAADKKFAKQTFGAANMSQQEFSEKSKAALTTPWIIKRTNLLTKFVNY